MKRINQPNAQRETLRIVFWHQDGPAVSVEHIEQMIPWGSGRYAAAAALKGIHQFFLPRLPGHKVDEDAEASKIVAETLEQWDQLMVQAREMKAKAKADDLSKRIEGEDCGRECFDCDGDCDHKKTDKVVKLEKGKAKKNGTDKSKQRTVSKARK